MKVVNESPGPLGRAVSVQGERGRAGSSAVGQLRGSLTRVSPDKPGFHPRSASLTPRGKDTEPSGDF